MATYDIHYSMIGSGDIEIEAESREAAEKIFENMPMTELFSKCNFKHGVDIINDDDDDEDVARQS